MSKLTDDDIAVWKALTKSVSPISTDIEPVKSTGVSLRLQNPKNVRQHRDYMFDNASGIERRITKQIHKGRTPTEAMIDLHGYTISQAHQIVISFLKNCYLSNKRKVLVITGNGDAIRREFPHWTEVNPLREIVNSCTVAHQRQGGNGAFVVALKKP